MRPLTHLIIASGLAFVATAQVFAENPTAPIQIRGYCVDGQGKGIAGAEVFLAEYALEHRRLAQTTSGPDGSFEFIDIAMPYPKPGADGRPRHGMFQVFGLADGYGFTWLPISRFAPSEPKDKVVEIPIFDDSSLPKYYSGEDITLKLIFPKAETLTGRVVDYEGKPISGASVQIRYGDREAHQLDYSRTGGPSAFDVLNEPEIVPPDVKTRVTDEDGRFKFSGLSPGCRFHAYVRTTDRRTQPVWLSTRRDLKADSNGTPIYTDGTEIAFPRTFRMRVNVMFADSRQLADKVLISASNKVGSGSGVTDSHGVAELSLPAGEYSVALLPRIGTPYLPARASLTVSEKAASGVTQLALDSAAVVEVSVTDVATGKGLEGVDLWVSKDGARALHFFRSYEQETKIQHVERPRTNAEGKLTALFPPGNHRIGIALQAWLAGYRPVEPLHEDIECRAGEPTRVKFQMTRDPAAP
jgi:protocatechuate 3,4-dioxygenase beta subunit